MSGQKHCVDSGVDESTCAKVPRTETDEKMEEDQTGTQSRAASSLEVEFNVEIKLRSTTKAARNDPKPPGHWQDALEQLLSTGEQMPENIQSNEAEVTQESVEAALDVSEKMQEIPSVDVGEAETAETTHPEEMDYDLSEAGETDYEEELNDEELDEEELDEEDEDRSEYDEFAEFKWLEEIDGFVTVTRPNVGSNVTEPKRIGYCEGKLIRRNQIRASFYDDMEEPSRETSMLAFELFDRYGCLRTEIKEHPVRKGSGIWNEEFDMGDILLIEYLRIDKEYRRLGLAKKVIATMLEKCHEKTRSYFAIAWPTILDQSDCRAETEGKTDAEKRALFQREEDIAIQLFRSMGFRRIGSTYWFGLASDPEHPSHRMAASDDYNPPEPHTHVPHSAMQPLQKSLAESEDAKCVDMLEQFFQQNPATYLGWLLTDEKGNTLLHTAAVSSKPKSVNWIMDHAFDPRMVETRNNEGDTPLEALLMHLEVTRTQKQINLMTAPVSDKFAGYSRPSVLCIARLKGLTKPTSIEISRLAAGCTCNQCISGFLSPRMCFALLCQAEWNHDMLSDGVQDDTGPDWVRWHEHCLHHLPGSVLNNLKTNKSMRQGFANMCDHIATCLRAKIVPTERNVLAALENASEWPPATKNFLQRGGTVAFVATMIFEAAMDQDKFAGDGEHERVFEKDIAALPKCRNDHEFGFVSGMCGYERVTRMRVVPATPGNLMRMLRMSRNEDSTLRMAQG